MPDTEEDYGDLGERRNRRIRIIAWVAIGSLMPTVKDAGTAFGAVILLMFVPLYMLPVVASDPGALVTQVLTYFPVTAPITAQFIAKSVIFLNLRRRDLPQTGTGGPWATQASPQADTGAAGLDEVPGQH